MKVNSLTGIERELVLRYLLDGNVPVIVTPIEKEDGNIPSLSSGVFPIAIKAENISILKEGIILLKNPAKNFLNFIDKKLRVEFYFNSVGVYFISEMKIFSSGAALVIPDIIERIEKTTVFQKYDFSVLLYYSQETLEKNSFSCIPSKNFDLFSKPAWNSIQFEKQKKAKEYLEKIIFDSKKNGKTGNGLHLINICRYLVEDSVNIIEDMQNRIKPFEIIYVNHERIVFGYKKNPPVNLQCNFNYNLKMSFSLKETHSITRDIYISCCIDNIFCSDDGTNNCADCIYLSLKEEDCRFLYEKTNGKMLI